MSDSKKKKKEAASPETAQAPETEAVTEETPAQETPAQETAAPEDEEVYQMVQSRIYSPELKAVLGR